jgi:hypothetical protein
LKCERPPTCRWRPENEPDEEPDRDYPIRRGSPISADEILMPPDLTDGVPHTVIVTCTMATTPTLTSTPSQTMTQTPGCSSCTGAGSITREPQGHGAAWSNDTVPSGQTVVTLVPTTGKQNTMTWIGCAITCYSMISGTGDPGTMDSNLSTDGDIDLTTRDLNFKDAASDLKLSYKEVQNAVDSDIIDALCGQGNYPGSNFVIAEVLVSGNTHFVVVTGQKLNPSTNQCDFTIADPAKADNLFLSDYGGTSDIRVLTKG